MTVLVAYTTQSGNTRKVAEAIYEQIEGDKALMTLGDVDTLDNYDLVFLGFPIHAFGPAEKAKRFMDRRIAGKKVALFITHGSAEDDPELNTWIDACTAAASKADIQGVFHCLGALAADITEMLLASDDPKYRKFGEDAPSTQGQPDEERLERARAFARRMLNP